MAFNYVMETTYVHIFYIFLFQRERVTRCQYWNEAAASSLLIHDELVGEKTTAIKALPQERNNEPLVLSTKVQPWSFSLI